MKCYYHRESDAVALCKACQRAVCFDCAADVPPGTACRGRCEGEVAAVNRMFEQSKSAFQKTGRVYRRNAWTILMLGLCITGYGVLALATSVDSGAILLVLLGAFLLLYAFSSFRGAKQLESVEPTT